MSSCDGADVERGSPTGSPGFGKGPSSPAPRFVGNILAFLLNLIGPKGLEFARYSLDYHTIRNYLHVRAEQHIPGYAKKIVEAYDVDGRIESMLQE
ncbi:hypothetical protein ACP70R_000298 [Stipagrostis hirtigluma subsp. patula]